jgi:hypothetical protein
VYKRFMTNWATVVGAVFARRVLKTHVFIFWFAITWVLSWSTTLLKAVMGSGVSAGLVGGLNMLFGLAMCIEIIGWLVSMSRLRKLVATKLTDSGSSFTAPPRIFSPRQFSAWAHEQAIPRQHLIESLSG